MGRKGIFFHSICFLELTFVKRKYSSSLCSFFSKSISTWVGMVLFTEVSVSLSWSLLKLLTPIFDGASFSTIISVWVGREFFSDVSAFFNPSLLKFSTPATLSYRFFFSALISSWLGREAFTTTSVFFRLFRLKFAIPAVADAFVRVEYHLLMEEPTFLKFLFSSIQLC
eukprot:TRINITY_DN50_c0_g1_i1.p1 TRINITY_DN50_c0_g1~~TRINITY_DN50_c0_g1_i1.p1  ORF type:complete len:169 (-),score=1.58 TRINITY_DN50_c0_g1_i1:103-609(-)